MDVYNLETVDHIWFEDRRVTVTDNQVRVQKL
jgi:hypothetical protein